MPTLVAQRLSVASFRLLENDLTANTHGTVVYDQNGARCALIKVETTQTGFSFDAGSLGVRKVVQQTGEIWVYVPAGVKRLTISHQQLGTVRDYDLGMSTQKAKTYLLQLTTGTVSTVVHESLDSQFLMFNVSPADATVLVNDESWRVNDGVARKYVPFGTYTYRVMCQDYLDETGVVLVNDPVNRHEVNVSLKPNFTMVTLIVDLDAEIWVNGEHKGNGSWTGHLGGGDYIFEARKSGYRSSSTRATIGSADGNQTFTLNAPSPIFGHLMVSTLPDQAEIIIDGVTVGTTPSMIPQVLEGTHVVTVRKPGYLDYSQTVSIVEGKTSTMDGEQEKLTSAAVVSNQRQSVSRTGAVRTFTVNGVSFNMIAVSGGTFQMGATDEQRTPEKNEKPVHTVTLSSYSIGETEVTQALWTAIMGKNPSPKKFIGNDNPVCNVSWKDCQIFIEKLNSLTGEQFRLPTEAEWEYAARGGNMAQVSEFSGGNNIGLLAWYLDNSGKRLHSVKTKQPNELGIFDMSGNLWELCEDKFGPYTPKAQTNPSGAIKGSDRVARGGSWENEPWRCRVAFRVKANPGDRDDRIGFRLAL